MPLSQTGSELLFDVFSRCRETGATIVISDLPLPGMDDGVRRRAPHPPCPYPGNERRELPAQAEPVPAPAIRPNRPRLSP